MKKLQVNMVFRNINDNADFRVIHISYDYTDIVCIQLNYEKALPYFDNTANIEAQLSNNELEFLENDPYFKVFDESAVQDRYLKARDTAFEYIKQLCSKENIPRICNEKIRSNIITELGKKYGTTKATIYKNMRLYLQGGMAKNSLLTHVTVNRTMNYSKKTGSKREVTQGEGIVVDTNLLLHIKNIYENYYLKVDGATIKQTYLEFLDRYYSYLTIENGKEVRKTLDDDKIPTLRQFTYHLDKIRNAKDEIINKFGKIKYQQTERPTLSREDVNVYGPGQLYEIDSTISDIYLVSNISRNIVVGRAVLYIIIDVYSRLITGYYAGLEESSWTAAMMAYMNMNENKVEFCKGYGIDIEEEQWPSHGIPSKINADRGETISKASDDLVRHLGITIENNPAYCPDMKGIVERWFKTINKYLQRYVPGGVRKDHLQRGGEDYRQNAVLNINEFNQLIIRFILSYNNTVKESFSMSRDMIDNQIIPTPTNIWNYGATMKLSFTTNIPKEKMMLTLMPKSKVSVERGGLCFHGLYYSCETGIRKNWFLKNSNGDKTRDIAFDPRNLNKIYLYDKNTMQFETCNMLPKSLKDYNDISLDELLKIRKTESKLKKLNNTENISLQINSHHQMKDIIDSAIKQSKMVSSLSKNKIKNIPVNKKIERKMMREEEYFDLDPSKTDEEAPVVNLEDYKSRSDDSPSGNEHELTYEEHVKKHNDEMNVLIQSIILGEKYKE
jgi:transposase InsO family protein